MHVVYRKAVGNLIYIGHGGGMTAAAFDNIKEIERDMTEQLGTECHLGDILYDSVGRHRFAIEGLRIGLEISALCSLYNHSWFR